LLDHCTLSTLTSNIAWQLYNSSKKGFKNRKRRQKIWKKRKKQKEAEGEEKERVEQKST